MHSTLKQIVLSVLATTLISACAKKEDNKSSETPPTPAAPPTPPPPNIKVAPNEVTNAAGCLDMPMYFKRLREVDQATKILMVTTDLRASSKKSLNQNFQKQLAYGSFSYEEKPIVEIPEFWPVTQERCETLTYTKTDGTQEVYQIIASSPTDLSARKENGEQFYYHFLNPTSIQIISEYLGFDHCSNNPQVFIEMTRVLDWSDLRTNVIKPGSALMISEPLLRTIAEAVGYDVNKVYTTTDQGKGILVETLREMTNQPPLPDTVACRHLDIETQPAVPPSPTEPPAPSEQPATPPTPGPAPEVPSPSPTTPVPAPAPVPPA